MKRGRYTIGNDWTSYAFDEYETYGGDVIRVETDTATLTDTRGGYTYPHGARRVTVKMRGGKKRTRTFIGEMAWADAKRWADEIVWDLRRSN
jgi:hypothetical protein